MDLLLAWRGIRRNPRFAILVIATLAIGIGANTTMYTLVRAVFLRPLPFPNPERLVTIWERDSATPEDRRLTPANFVDLRAQSSSFEELGVLPNWTGKAWRFNIAGADRPEQVDGIYASSSFFRAVGVRPLLGRPLDEQGDWSAGRRQVVIGFRYWRERFGGDREVIGKTIDVDTFRGGAFEIVGVMPPGFDLPHGAQIWLSLGDWGAGPMPSPDSGNRCCNWYTVIGRLKPGVSAAQAESELTVIGRRISERHPEAARISSIRVTPLRETIAGSHRLMLYALFAAVGCVLLIGCANVANLLLSRGVGRRQEMLTRRALGASSWRIARQSLVEGLVLSGAGALAGLWLSMAARPLVRKLLEDRLPLNEPARADWTVAVFLAVVALACGVLCSIAPLADWRQKSLAVRNRTDSLFSRRLRSGLVVAEIAVAAALAIGAGLLIRTVGKLSDVDMGFRAERMLTVSTDLTTSPLRSRGNSAGFLEQVVTRVEGLPSVRAAAATTVLPFEAGPASQAITIEGQPARASSESPQVIQVAVTPRYFELMGMQLRAGRLTADTDRADGKLVAVLNEAAARRYFPGQSPLGKRFAVGSRERFGSFRPAPPGGIEWREIVGVVSNIRTGGQRAAVEPEVYYSYRQFPIYGPTLLVRTDGDPAALTGAVRREIEAVNRSAIVTKVRTMQAVASEAIADPRLRAGVAVAFSIVAIALGMLGVYSVLSYTVAQRTREIGIRMALGAREEQVAGMIVKRTLALTAMGIAAGVTIAAMAARSISSLLFEVETTDPVALGGTCVLLAAAAVAASYGPARRATRVDPASALRAE
jgi:putative ABC transport system permease protein